MSIARPVGAMSKYLAKLLSGKLYFSLRETFKMVISSFQKGLVKKQVKQKTYSEILLQEEHCLVN
jgi:1-deoxy-D-xylulose-5-phosphate synthase